MSCFVDFEHHLKKYLLKISFICSSIVGYCLIRRFTNPCFASIFFLLRQTICENWLVLWNMNVIFSIQLGIMICN